MESSPIITLNNHRVVGCGSYGKVFVGEYQDSMYAVKRRYVVDGAPPGCIHIGEIDALCRFRHPYILRARIVQRQNPIRDNFRSDNLDTWGQSQSLTYHADLVYVLTDAANTDMWNKVTKPLSLDMAVKYTWQMLSAICYMHDMGFIHRDIKPQNILYYEREDCIKICDFDMCMPDIRGFTSFKAMTPEYTPPEILSQNENIVYTPKVDIWGVGIVLRFLLSGKSLLHRGDRRSDDMDKYLLAMQRKFFPNGSHIPQDVSNTDVSNEKVDLLTGIEKIDDLLLHMLDCNPDTRWDARTCLSHTLFSSPIPRPIHTEDHIIDKHFITDDMAKVFDAEFNSISEKRFYGFFLGLDILMRVCRIRSRMDPKKLAICCFNIGMKYYDKEIATCIPIDPNDAKRIEYDIIVEKLRGSIYRDTIYNHIQKYPNKIYRYMISLSKEFPVRFSELCIVINTHIDKKYVQT